MSDTIEKKSWLGRISSLFGWNAKDAGGPGGADPGARSNARPVTSAPPPEPVEDCLEPQNQLREEMRKKISACFNEANGASENLYPNVCFEDKINHISKSIDEIPEFFISNGHDAEKVNSVFESLADEISEEFGSMIGL